MGQVTIPFRFADGDTPGANPFNSNYDALASAHNTLDSTVSGHTTSIAANTTLIGKHGSRAFTGYTTTNNAIATNDEETLTYDTQVVDNNSVFDETTGKYVPALNGTYLLTATVCVTNDAQATDTYTVYIVKNAAGTTETKYILGTINQGSDAGRQGNVVSGQIVLTTTNAADEFYVNVACAAGGNGITVDSAIFSGCCLIPT